jgi:hypothetical protein
MNPTNNRSPLSGFSGLSYLCGLVRRAIWRPSRAGRTAQPAEESQPHLPAAPAARDDRWAHTIDRARAAEHPWRAERHTQLDQALTQLRDSTDIAGPARAEAVNQAGRVATLRAAL